MFQKSKLQGVVDIFEGHFCRSRIARDTATFDLMNNELKTSFHALLNVILHAARVPKPEAAKQPEDASEHFAISIPPMAVRQKLILVLVEEPASWEGPQKLLSTMWHEPSDYCLST